MHKGTLVIHLRDLNSSKFGSKFRKCPKILKWPPLGPTPYLPVFAVNIVLFHVGGALGVIQLLIGTRILAHPVYTYGFKLFLQFAIVRLVSNTMFGFYLYTFSECLTLNTAP